jgi:hypothetical protein
MRSLNGSVTSWPELYRKVCRSVNRFELKIGSANKARLRHLKPGSGFLEHIEIDIIPRCDDGPLPPVPLKSLESTYSGGYRTSTPTFSLPYPYP